MNCVVEKRTQGLEQKAYVSREPGLYEVILHNDDFTPMDFVLQMLQDYFHLDQHKANQVMQEAHTKGRAVCGIYTREVAETRVDQAVSYARTQDHPLRWSMEG